MENLDGNLFLAMVRSGGARLNAQRKIINDLNVFPIPDGDTGDNMYMTLEAGCRAAEGSLGETAAAVSQGMLMGARGKSPDLRAACRVSGKPGWTRSKRRWPAAWKTPIRQLPHLSKVRS